MLLISNNNTLFLVGDTGVFGVEVARGLVDIIGIWLSSSSRSSNIIWTKVGWLRKQTFRSQNFGMDNIGAKVIVSAIINVIYAARTTRASLYVPTRLGGDYHDSLNDTCAQFYNT